MTPPGSVGAAWDRWRRVVSPVVGLVVAGLAVELVLSSVGGVDAIVDALGRVDPVWVAAAVVAEGLAYLLLGLHLRRLARPAVDLRTATGLSLVWFGLGNALPGAPAPGIALAVGELRRRGMDPRDATIVMGLSAWFNARTFLVVGAAGGLTALALTHAPGSAWAWVGAALAVAVLLSLSAWLASRPQTARRAAGLLRRLTGRRGRDRFTPEAASAWHGQVKAIVGTPRSRVALATLGIGAWLADAACFALSLRAVGVTTAPDLVLLAYLAGIAVVRAAPAAGRPRARRGHRPRRPARLRRAPGPGSGGDAHLPHRCLRASCGGWRRHAPRLASAPAPGTSKGQHRDHLRAVTAGPPGQRAARSRSGW